MQNTATPPVIAQLVTIVQQHLKDAEGGHDWFHIERVWNSSMQINKLEGGDPFIVAAAALLHDIADSKFHNGDESIGPKTARKILEGLEVNGDAINHVVAIIENISFKGGKRKRTFTSLELDIVQDADRLDSIGAIGVARAFNYGGFKNRGLYDPAVPPNLNMSAEEYKKSSAPTINHFYEKLLLLKDLMNTPTGRKMAEERHQFMEAYLEQFYAEWDGKK